MRPYWREIERRDREREERERRERERAAIPALVEL
jgi:hypothetical protein